jgi:hypothetical protein
MLNLKTIRILVTPLLIIPAIQLFFNIFGAPSFYFRDEATAELLYLVIGLPILVANVVAWGATEIPIQPDPAADPAPHGEPADEPQPAAD